MMGKVIFFFLIFGYFSFGVKVYFYYFALFPTATYLMNAP